MTDRQTIVLGAVRRNLLRHARRIDALVLPIPSGAGRPSAAVIDRGILRPPWFVRGSARPLLGCRVCYSGRTSGPTSVGRPCAPRRAARGCPARRSIAREGDSGAPVYTEPAADATVRGGRHHHQARRRAAAADVLHAAAVLDALDATLVTSGGT
jgi:hypothetical protein